MDDDLILEKRCLTLISRIASKAASAFDPERPADALLELFMALHRREDGGSLQYLHQQLDFIDSTDATSLTLSEILKFESRSTYS